MEKRYLLASILSPLTRTARRRAMTEHRERMTEEAALRSCHMLHGHLTIPISPIFSPRAQCQAMCEFSFVFQDLGRPHVFLFLSGFYR